MLTIADQTIVNGLRNAAEVYERRALQGNEFANGKATTCRSIADRVTMMGGFASERQRSYAEALVRWAQDSHRRPTRGAQAASDRADANSVRRAILLNATLMPRLQLMFASALQHNLHRPVIRLQRGEWKVKVYPAPRNGSHPGALYVRATSGRGPSLYCGRIEPVSGQLVASADCPLDVVTALREFAEAPESAAQVYGQATGHCCFCAHPLTDQRSVSVGYGPICAEHYGLAWGDRPAIADHDAAALTPTPRRSTAVADHFSRARAPRFGTPTAAEQARMRDSAAFRANGLPRPAAARDVPLDEEDEDQHFM